MAKKSAPKRKRSPRRAEQSNDGDDAFVWQIQDRRSKHQQDLKVSANAKGKGKVQEVQPSSTKRMKELQLQQDSRRGFETSEDVEDDENNNDEQTDNNDSSEDVREIQAPVRRAKAVERKPDRGKLPVTVDERKPLTVDEKGRPYGALTTAFEQELRLMTRDLDPCYSMCDQPLQMRERFFKRLLEGWEVRGTGSMHTVDRGWITPRANKTLTNRRYQHGQMIDKGESKPTELTDQEWNKLVKKRRSEDSKMMSERMRAVSKGKGMKAATKASLREAARVKLSINLQREPFQTEINEEMQEQYHRMQAEKDSDGEDLGDLDTRMEDLEAKMEASNERLEEKIEASNTCLESKIDDSNQRLEAMFGQLIAVKASQTDSTVQQAVDMPVPAIPVLLQVNPTPTATTKKTRPPSPNHGASGVSNHSDGDDVNIGAVKAKEGGMPMQQAEKGGSGEGDGVPWITAADEVVQEFQEARTPASAAGSPEPLQSEQDAFETPAPPTGYVRRHLKPGNVSTEPSKLPKPTGLSNPTKADTSKATGASKLKKADEIMQPSISKPGKLVEKKGTATRSEAAKKK